jgi:hypothetical protein
VRRRTSAKSLTAWRDTVPAAFFVAGTRVARETSVVLLLEGICALASSAATLLVLVAPVRFESGVRLAPVIFLGEPMWRTVLPASICRMP